MSKFQLLTYIFKGQSFKPFEYVQVVGHRNQQSEDQIGHKCSLAYLFDDHSNGNVCSNTH